LQERQSIFQLSFLLILTQRRGGCPSIIVSINFAFRKRWNNRVCRLEVMPMSFKISSCLTGNQPLLSGSLFSQSRSRRYAKRTAAPSRNLIRSSVLTKTPFMLILPKRGIIVKGNRTDSPKKFKPTFPEPAIPATARSPARPASPLLSKIHGAHGIWRTRPW